jgi:hypothetical protein
MESGLQSTIYISFDKQPVVLDIVFAVGPLSPVIIKNFIPASLKSVIVDATSFYSSSSTPVMPKRISSFSKSSDYKSMGLIYSSSSFTFL